MVYQNNIFISMSRYSKILLISGEKILMSAELKGVSRDSYIFWIFFR